MTGLISEIFPQNLYEFPIPLSLQAFKHHYMQFKHHYMQKHKVKYTDIKNTWRGLRFEGYCEQEN